MIALRTRRLVPLMIVTALTAGGASLTTTAHAAAAVGPVPGGTSAGVVF
ncbi:hypothetical protein ABT237_16195 [Streptomyces sp. NPDC001581]